MIVEDFLRQAVEHHKAGRLREAEALYGQILARHPRHADAIQLLGVLALQNGRAEAARQLIQQAITLHPTAPEYHLNLGAALLALGRKNDAIMAFEKAAALRPDYAEAWYNLANLLRETGKCEEAAAAYLKALDARAEYPEAMGNLANTLRELGRLEAAATLYRQVLPQLTKAAERQPDVPEHHINLGVVLRALERWKEAVVPYRRAAALAPSSLPAQLGLAMASKNAGDMQAAIPAFEAALKINPGDGDAWTQLADALIIANRLPEAIAAGRKAIALRPDMAEPHDTLGRAHLRSHDVCEAITEFRRALELNGNLFEIHNNLAGALKDVGELDEAIRCYDAALKLNPDSRIVASNRLYTLNFHPDYDAAAILHQLQDWNRRHVEPLRQSFKPHKINRNSEKKLRIGYVSPDFRDHVVGRNILPLLREHDRDRFEIFCYSNISSGDVFTQRFRDLCDQWRPISGLSDQHAAEAIRRDRIDILVDLALHMSRNRLAVFAYKPAPIQVTFGGYPGGTGIETIDYRLTDPHLDPPSPSPGTPGEGRGGGHHAADLYVEESIRLPHSFWCYDIEGMSLENSPAVNALPAGTGGTFTFGCLNNFCKINTAVIELWQEVLDALPNSRLMVLAPPGPHRQRLADRLNGRVVFADAKPRLQYLEWYHQIDLGLDTFPYNGHTTSLDSFWMGVPVVTLVGQTAVGRAGLSQLTNLNLKELAAPTPDEFVRIAASLAADLPRLAELRKTLRDRMIASPLMDARTFARNIESAYGHMWRRWISP